jgi:kinesin family protein 6/9
MDYRNEMKDKRSEIKTYTQVINTTKVEMDRVKVRLDHKAEEKKLSMKDDFNSEAFDEEGGVHEEIIDEEELMLLKEMKDLKKGYRDNYDKLKNLKLEVNDLQTNIDNMKQ